MIEEIFRPIIGFKNYEISNLDNIRNINTNKILKYSYNGNTHYKVVLYKDGIKHNRTFIKKHEFYDKNKNKWHAHMMINYKYYNLGYFDTMEEAKQARLEKAMELINNV